MAASSTPDPSSIQAVLAAKLAEPPARRLSDEHYKPIQQSCYGFKEGSWQVIGPSQSSTLEKPKFAFSNLQLFSWNVDILVPFAKPRMAAAINHVEKLISRIQDSIPVVIFWQEMGTTDIEQLKAAPWIQERFNITDIDNRNWKTPLYGTTTLLDRRLSIQNVFRVPWVTKFERDGLFVDITLNVSMEDKVLRICNTHLESLVADPPVRPLQLEAAAKYMKEGGVSASVLAGDLNAIQPFDRTMVSENGLRDAYLELGGGEDSDEGYTWSQQVPQWMKDRFGCSRMDKILLWGDIEPKSFERFGEGVKVEDEKIRSDMTAEGQLEWVSDHLGVMAQLRFKITEPVLY